MYAAIAYQWAGKYLVNTLHLDVGLSDYEILLPS